MSIQETFEEIPRELTTNTRRVRILNRDGQAMGHMHDLWQNMQDHPPGAYARGSWGYTILRTVYTPESDDLFPSALVKLEIWVRQYHLHINRFPMWGERGEAEHKKLSDGSINDELGRRFRVELVQDEKRLNMPYLNRASQEDIRSLCDVFDDWVASIGQDPQAEYSLSPRFCDCLVVDEEALHSLAALPDEPLRLYVAADSEEKKQMRWGGDDFLWLLDTRAVRSFHEYPDEDPGFRGG
ncbi:rhamnogalacturonase [Apiospora arundinis]